MCAAQMQLGPEAKSLNLVVCFASVVSQGNSYFLTAAAAAVLHEDSVTMPCLSTTTLIRRNYATAASTTAVSGLLTETPQLCLTSGWKPK